MSNVGDPILKKFTTGRLFFLPTAQTDGYWDFGNTIDYKHAPKVSYVEHKHMDFGRSKSDFGIIKSNQQQKSFTLDEEFGQVLILLYLATQGSNVVQNSNGAVSGEQLTASSQAGRVYFTANAGISGVTVSVGETNYVNGTDYVYDPISGAVTLLPGTTIPNASTVTIAYACVAITDLNFAALNNFLSRGTFKHVEYDQFDTVPYATETFSGQVQVTAWGDDNNEKFTEFTVEALITPE